MQKHLNDHTIYDHFIYFPNEDEIVIVEIPKKLVEWNGANTVWTVTYCIYINVYTVSLVKVSLCNRMDNFCRRSEEIEKINATCTVYLDEPVKYCIL